jgi:hypothetical protein
MLTRKSIDLPLRIIALACTLGLTAILTKIVDKAATLLRSPLREAARCISITAWTQFFVK